MMHLSLAGLLGAVIGTVVAATVYGRLALLVERGVRSAGAHQRPVSDSEISMLRRVVLAADIVVFAGAGYWLGATIGG
jgi:hypothetical protein